MNDEIKKRDAEIQVLREVNSHLFWLVTQGDYSNPDGELIISAAKEGTTTAESAKTLIELCEKKNNGIQEHAVRRLQESSTSHQYLQSLIFALKESLQRQFQYAKLLNMNDGGERITFKFDHKSIDNWIEWLEQQKGLYHQTTPKWG